MPRNKGTAFERYLSGIFAAYERAGIATIRKVDPPSLSLKGGGTILLKNPWLDFTGTWTARGGRAIIIEAKHTEKPTLPINRNGGISPIQWSNLKMWKSAGAACFVLWEYRTEIRIITPELIQRKIIESGRVSLKFSDAIRIPNGKGFITYDILKIADHLTYPKKNDT